MIFKLIVTQSATAVNVLPGMPRLWVVRDFLIRRGAKYGCGIGVCRASPMHRDSTAMPSRVPSSVPGARS